jgi:putative transcriptional regulator
MEDSLRGKLLVASPALADPNFARTVVFITEHNDEGAMGIVLDRPSDTAVEAVVPPLAEIAGGSADVDLDELAAAVRRGRVYAGYSGWGPGQLEAEMEVDSWIVEPPLPKELFPDDPATLWRDVLARKGGQYTLISRMPDDPSQN